ncbi:MAG: aldehyde dehydrogenase family protein [Myxococcota bacterium]
MRTGDERRGGVLPLAGLSEEPMDHYRLFIDGEFVDAQSGQRFESLDPGTGAPIATVAAAGEAEVNAAVAAARRAFDHGPWSRMEPGARAEMMMELADLIQANITRLAMVEALDSGGLLARTAGDIFQGARFMRTMASYAATRFPWREELPPAGPFFPSRNYVRREPMGVCVGIIPWNFPFLMAIWKISMAAVMGNTVVLKPSPETPLSALLLAELIQKSRVPKGVINVVVGPDRRVGELLVRHPDVDRVAFTGSTAVGREILKAGADTIKRVSLELGGKSANIVLPDADLDMAVDGALFATFLHSGQVCESGTRLFLPESLHDSFLHKLVERARGLRVGYQMDPGTRVGPVVNARQRASIEKHIAAGRAEGATLVCGGDRVEVSGFENGFYLQPTVFSDVKNSMGIAREEIFGPVLCVLRYRDEDEAVALANDSSYGLAGGVWSRNVEHAQAVAARLRTGTTWINDWHVFNDLAPFGGYKQSGVGRELGHHGLAEYTEVKHVHVGTEGDPNNKMGHRLLLRRPRTTAYEYEPTTRIISGPGCVARLHSEVAALGKQRVLVITDGGVVKAGLLTRVQEALGPVIAAVFSDVPQDSGLGVIDAAAALGRRHNVDCVLSLGGGSVIDTAKGTAVALTAGVPAIQTIGMHHLSGPQLTHVVVPTTSGTGSEVTNVAVIKNESLRIKSYIMDRHVIPDVAFLDPLLTVGLPARMTAATGMDALTHAVEAYTSRTANPMSDAQAIHAIRLIAQNLEKAVKQPDNVEARTNMQSAATLAGWAIGSANVGLVHGMSHTVGARYGVPHGIGNGILLPHVMRYNAGLAPAAARLKDVADALGVDTRGLGNDEAASAAADKVQALLLTCSHPVKLSEVGVPREELEECARVAFVDPANTTSARKVNMPQEIEELYLAAY